MVKKSNQVKIVAVFTALALTLAGNKFAVLAGFLLSLTVALYFDRTSFRKLGKLRFWIFSIAVVLLAGLLLGKNPQQELGITISLEGLLAGFVMNLRAFTIILSFVMLARSLTQDRFLQLTSRMGLPHYIPAFQEALQTLPRMKNAMKLSGQKLWVFSIDNLVGFLLMAKQLTRNPIPEGVIIFGVTGRRMQGKTTLLRSIKAEANKAGIKAGGFIQERFTDTESGTRGYKVVSLMEYGSLVIAERDSDTPYRFSNGAFREAAMWLDKDVEHSRLLIVDEMGVLEARGEGHASGVLSVLTKYTNKVWVIALRKDKLNELTGIFGVEEERLFDLDKRKDDIELFIEQILKV